jgi:glycosyltransferase involved in cell wall biosynthesis
MRVLQLPTEIAGQANLTAQALRSIGVDSQNASLKNYYNYPVDIDLSLAPIKYLNRVKNPLKFLLFAKEYDLFHYHKSPMWIKGLDLQLLQRLGKKFFVEFWGSDIRLHDVEMRRNRFYTLGDKSSHKQLRRLQFWSKFTDEVIVSDTSMNVFLEPYFKKIHIVRQRIDTTKYQPSYPLIDEKKPKIVHAPSNMGIKGTEYIERAVENLRSKKLDFEYIRVTNLSNQEAMQIYKDADIIIDQLILGSHGIFACEAMALGKPVICYIQDSLIDTYPSGFPIINANPENIQSVLESLIADPKMRHDTGAKSREYVEKEHDLKVVGKRLYDIYKGDTF